MLNHLVLELCDPNYNKAKLWLRRQQRCFTRYFSETITLLLGVKKKLLEKKLAHFNYYSQIYIPFIVLKVYYAQGS